eukprot:gene16487-22501_t
MSIHCSAFPSYEDIINDNNNNNSINNNNNINNKINLFRNVSEKPFSSLSSSSFSIGITWQLYREIILVGMKKLIDHLKIEQISFNNNDNYNN